VLGQDLAQSGRHRHRSDPRARLRRSEVHRTPDLDELSLDADRSPQQVDVIESEAREFSPPHPHVAREDEWTVDRRVGLRQLCQLVGLEEAHRARVLRSFPATHTDR
jgi:hypothetical protein